MQENSHQLVMFSLIADDISQSFVSTNYVSFLEADDTLQNSFHSLCDQERSWDCKSNPPSYISTPKIFPHEETAHVQ